ncbi:MAG: GPR endopeptidase [Oscillospiraceae bacterium]|jgi:spore protease|nr:GPR endopeptidase [Oscillospiraceae bacterium]
MLQNRRTDLALEAQELWQESAGEQTQLKGVQARDSQREGYAVTTVRILDQEGAQALGKPAGTYVTLTVDGLARREEDAFGRAVRAVAAELTQLLAGLEGPVLVACLGNRAVTPDAVGPKVHDHLLITRHLVDQAPEHFGAFRPVASVAAGVLGTTGVESGELVGALTGRLKPVCIIAVDALASRSLDRLCRTIQLADTGIAPGSGVGNHRHALDRESLGVPVIAIGVPTVVDGATLAADLLGTADLPPLGREGEMLVTPKDIDSQVNDLAKVIGYGITLALQPGLTLEDMELLMS